MAWIVRRRSPYPNRAARRSVKRREIPREHGVCQLVYKLKMLDLAQLARHNFTLYLKITA